MDNVLTAREMDLLNFLIRQTSWITASRISIALSCSIRSVKNYISYINTDYPSLIVSSRDGYMIQDRQSCSRLLNESDSINFSDSENRTAYILQKLLLENKRKSLEELADELHISMPTLDAEILKVRRELDIYYLTLKTKNGIAYIDGDEKTKKKMISHLIYEQTKNFFGDLTILKKYFPDIPVNEIKKIITTTLQEAHFFIDDFTMTNFVMHICIILSRKEPEPDSGEARQTADSDKGHAIVTEICRKIGGQYNYRFSQSNILDLTFLLMTRLIPFSLENFTMERLEQSVDPEVSGLIKDIQTKIYSLFHLTLFNTEFLIRFSLHLKNLLVRARNHIDLRNPQLESIKENYPYVYEVSLAITQIISSNIHIKLGEDETAYIALHIGYLVEEQYSLANKLKAVFICPQYYSMHVQLGKKIQETFKDTLIITDVYSDESELGEECGYDFFISVMPFNTLPEKPLLVISKYFNTTDIASTANMIEKLQKDKQKQIMKNKLQFLFKEKFFYADAPFTGWKEALSVMAHDLEAERFIDGEFIKKMFDREEYSPSAYGNIAMPHPLEKCAQQTVISVAILPKGILWKNNRVNIVFLLAIRQEDRALFKDIFDFVTDIISDDQYLKIILQSETYKDFIDNLISYL
jgi:lichenan operon transcriptional antiterminator